MRSTEVRIEGVEYDEGALEFVSDAAGRQSLRIIASRPEHRRRRRSTRASSRRRGDRITCRRRDSSCSWRVAPGRRVGFLATCCRCSGVDVGGFRVLRCTSPAIPNAIAGLLLDLRDRTDSIPHAYFGWTEGNPIAYLLKFLAFGEGDTAPVCREVLRKAEPDPERRPRIHVG